MENFIALWFSLILFLAAYCGAWFSGPKHWRHKLKWIGGVSIVLGCTMILLFMTPEGVGPFAPAR